MQITYSVTPDDVAAVYTYNWNHAPRVRRKLFLFAALIAGGMFLISYIIKRATWTVLDVLLPIIVGILFLLALPYLIKRGTKTQPRTLRIDLQGVTTEIGTLRGAVPWSAVESIVRTDTYIFVTGKNTNAFVIPQNAFADEAQRNEFYELARQYHGAVTGIGTT